MSYTLVKAGLFERLETVAGLKVHLKFEPNNIQDAPAVYSILQSFERSFDAGRPVMFYRTLHRLWIKWQDNAAAETQLDTYVDLICAAIDDPVLGDPFLGGRLSGGSAEMTDGIAEWREMGGVLYRTIDFFTTTVDKPVT